MPVGTSFENSAMKASFSLSSLSETTHLVSEKGRQFNSLTKKRVKSPEVRKSWGSSASEHRDDFWSALQENYNYIMDNDIIDKCQEVTQSDIELGEIKQSWTLEEFITQYSKLCHLLDSVTDNIYGNEENIRNKNIRLQCHSMVLEHSPLLTLLNNEASQLIKCQPEVEEDVTWRLAYLNVKWETILEIVRPKEGDNENDNLDVEHEIKCLKKWIKDMKQVLQPIDLKAKFTKTELDSKIREQKVLHKEIERQGKIVGSLVKLCQDSDDATKTNYRKVVLALEAKWHHLFLRSLEWQLHLENLITRFNSPNKNNDDSDNDFSFEPANKYPRLSGCSIDSTEDKDEVDHFIKNENKSDCAMNTETINLPPTDFTTTFLTTNKDYSPFTKTEISGPNLATYYFKHEDTDSDMEKVGNLMNPVVAEENPESSEEDEWVYKENKETEEKTINETKNDNDNLKLKGKELKRLVQKAEELVSPEKKRGSLSYNKISRVKQWLNIKKQDMDSCDASGEDEERESQLSEDFDEITFKACGFDSQNTSRTELNSMESTPKVQMRNRRTNGNRPWSVSCILQLEKNNQMSFTHSTSETALNAITPTKINEFSSSSAQTIANTGNNSTSSTVEESNNLQLEDKSSPCKRRRIKIKRKCSHKSFCSKNERFSSFGLFKSSSYSGHSGSIGQNDRQTSSDPPSGLHTYEKYDTTTSGAETDDSINKRLPTFKVGLQTNYLNREIRDTSPSKSSLNTAEEQSSSLSEQAWDSYQEKYLSEAYSEAHDSDAARKLLEFGEDYRSFIDSQSDWSTGLSPVFKRKMLSSVALAPHQSDTSSSDSCDSDSCKKESLKRFINSSKDQLLYSKNIYSQQVALGLEQYLENNEVSEMMSNCERHIDLLNHIEKSPDVNEEDKKAAAELLEMWWELKEGVLTMQEYRNLQKGILQLKKHLATFDIAEISDTANVNDLHAEVNKYKNMLHDIVEQKPKLFELNITANHFLEEHKEYIKCSLKNDIANLYHIWEKVHQRCCGHLNELQPLLENWKTLEDRLNQLHGDLQSDEKTLSSLDKAIQCGILSEQTALLVRDVAKLLSETTPTKGCTLPELFSEGSFSDSGISDEGSEQEIGERERRLAAIRRLVRQLEISLSPDSECRNKMTRSLNLAEEELKELQKKCRYLIVKSATCSLPPNVANESCVKGKIAKEKEGKNKDNDEEPTPDPSTSWFRRAIWASIPFPLVLVTIICIAWLMEPQCCDNMNTYKWSITPKLRYTNGPPPI